MTPAWSYPSYQHEVDLLELEEGAQPRVQVTRHVERTKLSAAARHAWPSLSLDEAEVLANQVLEAVRRGRDR